ncbi:hypothetical protein [Thalassomonas sp. RHCl1]|uniref:hypothetical protein n=1 Tax=Thalassomonas sp. RHCl1 TaxID=2995320 RepID=UPI00248D321B|nr:hypothetical protein [Thalassomonas sp. RHCl1]
MYQRRQTKDYFGRVGQEFTPIYNDASEDIAGDKGPPLVVNPHQGEDVATPPPSPSRHETAMRTHVPDEEYRPGQDLMVNLGAKMRGRRSSYDQFDEVFDDRHRTKPLNQADRNEIRAYAALTNDYLQSQGAPVTPSRIDKNVDRVATNMQSRSRTRDSHKGKKASKKKPAIPKGPKVLQKKVFGHVPDKPLTAPRKAASQMGVLPMSNKANYITGRESGLGDFVRHQKPAARFLVRERDNQYYQYHSPSSAAMLPSAATATSAAVPVAATTTSAAASVATSATSSTTSTAPLTALPVPVATPAPKKTKS